MRALSLLLLAGCSNTQLSYTKEDWNTTTSWDTTDADTTASPADTGPVAEECEGARPEPVTLFMSADDSNSQGAPVWVRALLEGGDLPSGEQRLYEFLNYYQFDFPPAAAGHVDIHAQSRAGEEPGTYEVLVAVVAPQVDNERRRPVNLTFSLDTSCSMTGQGFAMLEASVSAAASSLREGDFASVVNWSNDPEVLLDGHRVTGPDDPVLLAVTGRLTTSGATDLAAGLAAAYQLADANYVAGSTNRVLLVSDGGANMGITDGELIGNRAEDREAEGIYVIGAGAGPADAYDDDLMNAITDLGKGAYVFLDSASEAERMFTGERFVSNMEVAARNVQLGMTLPAGWVVQAFHGEQISTNPAAVRDQNLGPNDAMLYHMVLAYCGDGTADDAVFAFDVDWEDPVTGAARNDAAEVPFSVMLDEASTQIVKAQAIVAWGEALTDIWSLPDEDRAAYADGVYESVRGALRVRPDDADLAEILDLADLWRARW